MRVDLSSLSRMRLVGDENTGVGLDCLDCYLGGQPIAYSYYEGFGSPAYQNVPEVIQVDASIAGLILAGVTHRTSVHGDPPSSD